MDPNNKDLISPTPFEKKTINNQPTSPNFESQDPKNYPQDQGEIRNQGPSVAQLFKAGIQKTSFNGKTHREREINFLTSASHEQHEGTPDESQKNELAQEQQEQFEQARLKWGKVIKAKSRSQRSGFAHLNYWEGTKMEIEEDESLPENEEDDLLEKMSDDNQGSFIQEREKFDLNERRSFTSWNDDNKERLIQGEEEIIQRKPDLNANGFFKDSYGNQEYSVPQNIETPMSAKFNLNANESFDFSGFFSEVLSKKTAKKFSLTQ